MAELHWSMGDYAQAEPLCRQARDITKQLLGEKHPRYAGSLSNLALLYTSMGEFAKAEPLLRQALGIQKQILGEAHPDYAVSLSCLAELHWSMGDYAQAEPLCRQALDIQKQILGEAHPDYATTLNNFAGLYRAMGDYAQAELLRGRALAISRRSLERAALVQSERQQLAMGQMLRYRLDGYLSLALESGDFPTAAAREALRWKGATLVRQRAMRLAAEDPNVADHFRELQLVTRQLASLSRAAPANAHDVVGWRERISQLTGQKETLEARLSRDSAAFREATQDVTLDQIQAALPNGGVLVDYLQFVCTRPGEEKGQWDFEPSLLAIVLHRQGEPALLELGPIAPIREAIHTWRTSFGMSADGMAAGRTLRQRLWAPVLRQMASSAGAESTAAEGHAAVRTILVSTDGVLGQLPLGALPGRKEGTYLIEDHRLAMIPVPQLLPALVDGDRKVQPRILLALGDVDYETATASAQPSARKRFPLGPRAARTDEEFSSLENTRGEIEFIRGLCHELFAIDAEGVELLTGRTATEARFRDLSPQFYHLHLATHGFFASRDTPSALSSHHATASRAVLASRDVQVTGFNPGLLSGLAFAGANRHPVSDADDGILTAQEIAFLPLGGVDTVVLSACETGLGAVAGGEGLLGVQRAFQISGARTTVASYWKVHDLVTRRLMERFYRNLWKKELPRLDALREAQLHILNNPASIRGAKRLQDTIRERVPPYYWAAFTLTGDWR
jgi:CHAT domain-containing protein/tetratricopeptide (TPR) repeat protein